MIYLTEQHTQPPSSIVADGKRTPTAPLVARNDTARLAQYGIYPHETVDGAAPLGYTDWAQDADGVYWRAPAGTEQERQDALDAQAAAAHEAYLNSLECTRLQGKLALIQADLFDDFEALIETLLPLMNPAQRVFVFDAPVWKYRDPVLDLFVSELQMSDAQKIELFELARTL